MKCKIINSRVCWDLENQVNLWLESNKDMGYYNMSFQYAMSDNRCSVFITYCTNDYDVMEAKRE